MMQQVMRVADNGPIEGSAAIGCARQFRVISERASY